MRGVVLLLCVASLCCGESSPEPVEQLVEPLLFGHRGTPLFRPENTIPAFDYAFDSGGDGVEVDVRLTSDGTLVAIHDSTLARTTTGGSARVADVRLSDLQTLDAGSWFDARYVGTVVPSLETVVAQGPGGARFMFDVKSDDAVAPIVDFIDAHALHGSVWIASTSIDRLDTIEALDPTLPLVWWIPDLDLLPTIDNSGVEVIRIPKSIESDPSNVQRVLDAGFDVAISGSFISWRTRFGLVNNMKKTVQRRAERKP